MQTEQGPPGTKFYVLQTRSQGATRAPSFLVVLGLIIGLVGVAVVVYFAVAPLLQGGGSEAGSYVEGEFVEVVFTSDFPSEYKSAFVNAAKRWSSILNGTTVVPESLESEGIVTFLDTFGCVALERTVRYDEPIIDHLVILAEVRSIDGPNNVLAQAYPCGWVGLTEGTYTAFTENTSVLPTTGHMQFDSTDIASLASVGRLEDTVLHEMGHVLGIGTFWDFNFTISAEASYALDLLQDPVFTFEGISGGQPVYSVNPAATPSYSGAFAVAAYSALGGSGEVPVEDGGDPFFFDVSNDEGLGTVDSHWKEGIFDSELMTGMLEPGAENPLSAITVESLRDLGYTVDSSQSDFFEVPARRRLRNANNQYIDLRGDTIRLPKAVRQQVLLHKIQKAKNLHHNGPN